MGERESKGVAVGEMSVWRYGKVMVALLEASDLPVACRA